MRVIATSDLHYNIARSRAPTREIARKICSLGGDVLMLVGDSASIDLAILDEVFGLFESFKGERLAVAGNHELWTVGGQDSLRRHEVEMPEACRRNGFHYLDAAPYQADGVAFVGNVGWYDYSFRRPDLEIPLRFYEHKVSPGAASRLEEYEHLVERTDDISQSAFDFACRWMDGERVNLPFDDTTFAIKLVDRLRSHLRTVHDSADQIVVGIHHLPFAELVPTPVIPSLAFAAGFLGSEKFGNTLLDFPKITHVLCGHSHKRMQCQKNGLHCTSIGSTYKKKQYEIVDL